MIAVVWDSSNIIAIVAIVAGVFGTLGTQWYQRRIREDDRRDQHRREAALALGPVYSLVSEIQLLMENAAEGWVSAAGTAEQLKSMAVEWRRLKPAIMALGVSYPEARVREAATSLARDIDLAVLLGSSAAEIADEAATTSDEGAATTMAKSGFMRATLARKQLDKLAAAIRGDGPKKRTPAEKAAEKKRKRAVQELEEKLKNAAQEKVLGQEPEG